MRRPSSKLLLPAAALVSMICASPAARAALIAYDGFESYSIGGLSGGNAGTGTTGASGETGWSAAWNAVSGINVASASLSYSNGTVVVNGGNQVAQIDGATNNTDAADRAFTSQTGTLYFSFLFSSTTGSLSTDDFIHFMLNNDTVNTNSGGIGKLTTTDLTLGARIGTTNGGTTTSSSTSMVDGATYFLVGKISKVSSSNYNQIDLYINPSSNIEPGTTSATSSASGGFSSIPVFSLRTFNLDVGDAYRFDELRVGTTFADVVPTSVPEPSAVTLLCGGVAMFLNRRRRA